MQIRNIILTITIGLIQLSTTAQGTWEKIDVPTTQSLHSVYFTDSLYGWAVGDTGTIIHTSDGGQSWVIQNSQTENNIRNVFFLNRNLGWAASWNFEGFFGTLILKTTNGGATWTGYPYPENNIFINCILYLDSLNGWMGGSPHAIVKTTDGGINWTQAAVDTNALAFFPVLNIAFYDENYGYACGGLFDIAGVTWSTSNGGEKWYPIDNADAPADEVHGLHLFDSVSVLGSGGDPDFGYGVGMIRTANGGINWNYEELTMQGNAYDIDFRNETEAWAPLGPRQKLIYSLDAGTNWTEIPSPDNTAIFDIIFPDSLHGYAVGDHGACLRYKAPPVSIADPIHYFLSDHIDIHFYPNPCRSALYLRYQIHDTRYLIFDLYSISGIKIDRITEKQYDKGTHELEYDVSYLPSGVYYIRINDGLTITVHKIIVQY